jgi:hypothetical protein
MLRCDLQKTFERLDEIQDPDPNTVVEIGIRKGPHAVSGRRVPHRHEAPPVFRRIAPPSATELQALVHRIAERIGRALERQGLLIRDCETSYLTLDPADDSAMNDLLGHSITYRVAVGQRLEEQSYRHARRAPIPVHLAHQSAEQGDHQRRDGADSADP